MIAEIPEIGPYLGRLADAVRRFSDPGVGLDVVRLQLVTALFERTQSAREFLLTGDEGAGVLRSTGVPGSNCGGGRPTKPLRIRVLSLPGGSRRRENDPAIPPAA